MGHLGTLTRGYSNIQLFSPDGLLMCRISERRANWYLERDLAEVITEDPLAIKLTFEPNGLGNHGDPFYTEERKTQCVVCGEEEALTKHHCVPYCFRRHFPLEHKSRLSHDVLMMCVPCHEKYEQFAHKRKLAMIEVDNPTEEQKAMHRICKAANTLHNYRDKIPLERVAALMGMIAEVTGQPATDELIEELAYNRWNGLETVYRWREYVEGIEDIEAFIRDWRQHFLDTMEPKHMPPHWSVEGRYASETPD